VDDHTLNSLIAQISAVERVVTLLLADALHKLPLGEAEELRTHLDAKLAPPRTDDLSTADHWAGRTIEHERVLARILGAAQEIATLRSARTA
jgi:hypothetical protein